MTLRMEHDSKADAIYITLRDETVAHTEKLDDLRYIDYSPDNHPVGIELLCVSRGVIADDLPQEGAVIRILEQEHIKIFA